MSGKEEKVTLSKSEHDNIQRELAKLYALEANGVANWAWYDESLNVWRKENEMDETIADLVCEFHETVDDLALDAEVDYPAGMDCGANVQVPHNSDAAEKFINLVINKYKEITGGAHE